MNNITLSPEQFIFAQGSELKTTSLNVAEAFGKLHKDVLRKIEAVDCSKEFSQRNFTPAEYLDEQGKSRPSYEMTKDGFIFVIMSFTGKKAAEIKESYINAFNLMHDKLFPAPKQTEQPLLTYATKEQRQPLIKAVRKFTLTAQQKGKTISFSDTHSLINMQMGVDDVEHLTSEQITEAVKMVGTMLKEVVMEGDYISYAESDFIQPDAYLKINAEQKRQLSDAVNSSFCGWVFHGDNNQHVYNLFRSVFNLQNVDDLPADKLPDAMKLVGEIKEKNWQFLLLLNELKEEHIKTNVSGGAPWTPRLKGQWKKQIGKNLPDRPDWLAIKAEIETKLAA